MTTDQATETASEGGMAMHNDWWTSGWPHVLPQHQGMMLCLIFGTATTRGLEGDLDEVMHEIFGGELRGVFRSLGENLDSPILWLDEEELDDAESEEEKDEILASAKTHEATLTSALQAVGMAVPATIRELAHTMIELGIATTHDGTWNMPEVLPRPDDVLTLPNDVLTRLQRMRQFSDTEAADQAIVRHLIDDLDYPEEVFTSLDRLVAITGEGIDKVRAALDQLVARRKRCASRPERVKHFAVLGTGQAPARRTFAQISRHLDTADSELARAVRAEEQADAIDLQLARLRESNRIEGDAERKIVARLALKRTVLTGRRRMREAADVMHARIEDRTRQITELDDRAAELRAGARALRDSARNRIQRSTGTDSDRPLSDRIAECRAQLPALAVRLSRADADRHEELLRQAAEQRTIAALETRKACGLREEAELRARLTPGQAVRETEARSMTAREAAAARQARQNLRRTTHEAGHRNRAASPQQPQGWPGPGLGR